MNAQSTPRKNLYISGTSQMGELMKKLVVDKEKCIGSQTCVAIAPEVFELDDNGKSQVKNQQGADEATIEDAIKSCPVEAIFWKEE